MHPWLTLERMLGVDDALRVTCWLFRQVQPRIIDDYLKIDRYFMTGASNPGPSDGHDPRPDVALDGGSEEGAAEFDVYAGWARQAMEVAGSESEAAAQPAIPDSKIELPRLRRSQFFKVLKACGVQIEQGKGSEIKLLRGAAHPFRLGNHYGPNPTIPTFLAVDILKRLQITGDEWSAAIASSRV